MKVVTKEVKNTPAPEAIPSNLEDDQKLIEEFKKDPEFKQKLAELAFQIQKEFTGWFTITKLVKVFSITQAEAAQKLEMLMLMNFCVGKVEKNILYCQIDMSLKVQRQLLTEEIAEMEGKLLFLKEKLSKLN